MMTGKAYFIDEVYPAGKVNNAGSKARDDASAILDSMGFQRIEVEYDASKRTEGSVLSRLLCHMTASRDWKHALAIAQAGDTVIIQFPLMHHSLFAEGVFEAVRKRGVEIILLVHDLDFIRLGAEQERSGAGKRRIQREELSLIGLASKIIVHNDVMKSRIESECGLSPDKVVSLGIFDYLVPPQTPFAKAAGPHAPAIIAGNLQHGKADYAYRLPGQPDFNLYGTNFAGSAQENIHYCGEYTPEELISNLDGSFGVIWDGPSTTTCEGAYGAYLRINNPHKTSLYLAAGLPIVIWDEAALAPLITGSGAGIAISSLEELSEAMEGITDEEYERMCDNARALSSKLREGRFLQDAVREAMLLPTPA